MPSDVSRVGEPSLRLVDSITELKPTDAGCMAVSGSHGGISAARYALAVRPMLTVFNDAGVGRDAAGIAGLALLEQEVLAACAVSHDSACIGQAMSTWTNGMVSHANACALAMGVRPGFSIRQAAAVLGVASLGTNPQKR